MFFHFTSTVPQMNEKVVLLEEVSVDKQHDFISLKSYLALLMSYYIKSSISWDLFVRKRFGSMYEYCFHRFKQRTNTPGWWWACGVSRDHFHQNEVQNVCLLSLYKIFSKQRTFHFHFRVVNSVALSTTLSERNLSPQSKELCNKNRFCTTDSYQHPVKDTTNKNQWNQTNKQKINK